MKQSNRIILAATLFSIASAQATADDAQRFYDGAGAGYIPAQEVDLLALPSAVESLAAFAGLRLNSRLVMEGFYADFKPMALLSEHGNNLYTRSFLGSGLDQSETSTVAGISVVTNLGQGDTVRPFARVGLHHYDLQGRNGDSLRGDSLLIGAGANVDLFKGWDTRLEWENYGVGDGLQRNIFSASFEYKF